MYSYVQHCIIHVPDCEHSEVHVCMKTPNTGLPGISFVGGTFQGGFSKWNDLGLRIKTTAKANRHITGVILVCLYYHHAD